jgi:predicted Zn finger-like uncharacterized protein
VVVVCESCSTRFRIDDAQIPAKGRLVRCSQCKATFVAKPEASRLDETIQEVVDEVTQAGGMPVPEPSLDLFAAGGQEIGATRPGSDLDSDEERWEFDETPRAERGPRGLDAEPGASEFEDTGPPSARAGSGLDEFGGSARDEFGGSALEEFGDTALDEVGDTAIERGGDSALEEVGDPAEWDLLRDSVEPAAREAKFVERPLAAEAPVPAAPKLERGSVESSLRLPAAPESVEETPPQGRRAPALGPSFARLGRLGLGTASWGLLVVLGAIGVTPLLATHTGTPTVRMLPKSVSLADGEAHSVAASFVENAFAGTLLAIRGELSRPAGDPRLGLRVYLLDAQGARVGAARWAGAPLPVDALRLRPPELLDDELAASAATAARGGAFLALFALPAAASDFELVLEPLPDPEPAPAEMLAAPAPAGATASSGPSSPPSSE